MPSTEPKIDTQLEATSGVPDLDVSLGGGYLGQKEAALYRLKLAAMQGLSVGPQVVAYCGISVESLEDALEHGYFRPTKFSIYRSDDKPPTTIMVQALAGKVREEDVPHRHLLTRKEALEEATEVARTEGFVRGFLGYLGGDMHNPRHRWSAVAAMEYTRSPEDFKLPFLKKEFGEKKIANAIRFAADRRGIVMALAGDLFRIFHSEAIPGSPVSLQVPEGLAFSHMTGFEAMGRHEAQFLLALFSAKG